MSPSFCLGTFPFPHTMPPKLEDHVEMASRAVQAMLRNPSINYFGQLEDQNTRLLEENNKRAVAQEQQEQRLVQLLELRDLATKRADSIARDLAARERTNKDLYEDNLTLRRQLAAAQASHGDVSKKLHRLEGFSIKMLPSSDEMFVTP